MKTLLVLDDDGPSLRLVSEMLALRTGAKVVSTRFPSEAIRLSTEKFFDVVIVDVSLNFRGSPFGGFDVYGELLARYGTESIIAYSQVITDTMLKNYPFVDNFVDKHREPVTFADDLARVTRNLRAKQSCFIAMPFVSSLDKLYERISAAATSAGYVPVRVDQQHFTQSIVQQVLWEIRRAKVVVFVATGKNPNAFYECGFAVALNKEVVTVTDDFGSLPFDIRDRNAIEYSDDLSHFELLLTQRLSGLTA